MLLDCIICCDGSCMHAMYITAWRDIAAAVPTRSRETDTHTLHNQQLNSATRHAIGPIIEW
eukprot:5935712-Amphidinium_carterae.1